MTAISDVAPLEHASSSPLAPTDLRGAFRCALASTWVVTGSSESGPVGFTAISVSSVSVEPPLVSFNIAKNSSSLVTIARTRRAALHLLASGQEDLARRFAGDRAARFVDDGAWSRADDGLPRLHGVVTRLRTRIEDLVDAGDSFIAIAAVEQADRAEIAPLGFHAGGFLPFLPTTD